LQTEIENIINERVGNWILKISRHQEIFPEWAINNALETINQWKLYFPKENTWVYQSYGIPSIILRLDCIINAAASKLEICEIEERPAAIGISTIVNPEFKVRLNCLKSKWPDFETIVSPRRETTDDYLWAKVSNNGNNDKLVLTRVDPDEEKFSHLQARSISTIKNKGNKSYGVPLGLWKEVNDISQLPWDQNFVLKPQAGSKCKDVVIFLAKRNRKIQGASTRSHAEEILRKNKKMYLQPYIPPMKCPVLGIEDSFMLYRFFFGYNPETHVYIPLGGVWNARKNYKIQGASDTIWGPLIFEPCKI
jgi:hypothetical protein